MVLSVALSPFARVEEWIMKRIGVLGLLGWVVVLGGALAVRAADQPQFDRLEDVIYGRKWGMALTLDVFAPRKDANGAAIIFVVSGGWFSGHEGIDPGGVAEFLRRGYTVFAVVHGSQPKYTIPEILQDMNRAVRFIRYHAKDYHIDPDRIGIAGGSAGGHLSLMQGTAGDAGSPDAKDPIDRVSSRVQAVACFFPPTDFLNWGEEGHEMNSQIIRDPFKPALDFHDQDKQTRLFHRIEDRDKVHEILKQISPITHVGKDSPPTLIIHGERDTLVPIQQAERIRDKFKQVGVPVDLIVKKGAGHGWPDLVSKDMPTITDWFDKYLGTKKD
jgi:acetyl esterase/lipase